MNHPEASAAQTPEDVRRVQEEMNRPDTELVRKQIEFLKLFDPDYKEPFPRLFSPHHYYGKSQD